MLQLITCLQSFLGLTDNLLRKCPNASETYSFSKTCFAINKTYEWLDSLDSVSLQRATAQARMLKTKNCERLKGVQEQIAKRLGERKQQREDVRRKRLTKQTKGIIDDLANFRCNVLNIDSSISTATIDLALSVSDVLSL